MNAALRTLDARRHNLPGETTPLIGRVDQLAELAAELGRERLGVDLLDSFPGGAWWVDLAWLRDPRAIGSTLLAAIGANEDGSRPAMEIAQDRLSRLPALVVFDNCEHLIADAATPSTRCAVPVPSSLCWRPAASRSGSPAR